LRNVRELDAGARSGKSRPERCGVYPHSTPRAEHVMRSADSRHLAFRLEKKNAKATANVGELREMRTTKQRGRRSFLWSSGRDRESDLRWGGAGVGDTLQSIDAPRRSCLQSWLTWQLGARNALVKTTEGARARAGEGRAIRLSLHGSRARRWRARSLEEGRRGGVCVITTAQDGTQANYPDISSDARRQYCTGLAAPGNFPTRAEGRTSVVRAIFIFFSRAGRGRFCDTTPWRTTGAGKRKERTGPHLAAEHVGPMAHRGGGALREHHCGHKQDKILTRCLSTRPGWRVCLLSDCWECGLDLFVVVGGVVGNNKGPGDRGPRSFRTSKA